jgi:hypothetical protein
MTVVQRTNSDFRPATLRARVLRLLVRRGVLESGVDPWGEMAP